MDKVHDRPGLRSPVDHRGLAVALMDLSSDVRRKSHEGTGVLPLPNGAVEILRVIEGNPGITVAEVASRLNRQLSNVSAQLRELVARGLVTRTRGTADKRYVTLHPTEESLRIKNVLETAWAEALEDGISQLLPAEQARIQECLPALQRLASLLGG
jgi:DNA-binding MarR family transcriptional regulator